MICLYHTGDSGHSNQPGNNFNSYASLLRRIRQRVSLAQKRVIYTANEELLHMYWDIGEMLQQSQDADGWGKKTLQRLSDDLKNEYPEVKGSVSPIAQSMIAQLDRCNFTLPVKHLDWTHNLIIMQQVKDIRARYWYMLQCISCHWSIRYLQEAIRLDYYGKHGALANNFSMTLPEPEAREVGSMLKDPYIFDMLTFTDPYNERDVEIGLVKHIEKFLIEMGAGFAFMGRQYHIEVSGDDYYIDILMYNVFLHRYFVIELKNTDLKPEYIGKLNFYCSAVDDLLRHDGDNRTIGLLLYRNKNRIKAEYALRDIEKPIGISEYELGQALPEDFKSSLPSIEEIEKEFGTSE